MTPAELAGRSVVAHRTVGAVLEEVHHRLKMRAAQVRSEARAGAPDAGGEVERVIGIAQGLELAAEIVEAAVSDPRISTLAEEQALTAPSFGGRP